MQNRIAAFSILFLIFTAGMAQKKDAPLFKKLTHIDKSDTLPYRLLEPYNVDPQVKYPLFIFLHGAGERGTDNFAQVKHITGLWDRKTLDKYPCFVLAPQCPKKQVWSELMNGKAMTPTPTRPMQLFIQTLDKIIKEYPIDPSRVYISGVSMGGFGTWDLLARFPNRFAAAIPICGGGDEKSAEQFKHVPIWAFHGALDRVVPPELSRNMIKALQSAGGLPGYTEYPDVEHNSWVQAYREPHLMPWLFKQKLTPADSK
jgi:predicted peptidase